MSRIRVLVVEDSLTVRRHLVEALEEDPAIEVVGEASDGRQGLELCCKLHPDVVTLDMVLPGLNGVEATEQIMAWCPTPIVIVSSSTNRGELYRTFDALTAGALDMIDKPSGEGLDDRWTEDLRRIVKTAAKIRVITHPRGRLSPQRPAAARELLKRRGADPPPAPQPQPRPATSTARGTADPAGPYRVVAIGGSTGAPGAIVQILRGLPTDFPLPVLLVIHLSHSLGWSFARWLADQGPARVEFAEHGQLLPRGGGLQVFVAPPDRHLTVSGGRLWLTDGPERNACRPSVDELFYPVAREFGSSAIAVLLTGMGRDGADGLLKVRQAGGATLVQDESTSVVFGMPLEAIRLGAAGRVLPLPEIAAAILALAGESRVLRRGP